MQPDLNHSHVALQFMLKYVNPDPNQSRPLADSEVSVPLYSYLTQHGGGSDPNSALGNLGADALIVNITDTRNMLKTLGLSIPVGNSDAGSYFNNKVLAAVDYGVRLGSRRFPCTC